MTDDIKPFSEWIKNPSYHGSYDDYVRHMRAMKKWREREAEDRLADKIATKLAERLKR